MFRADLFKGKRFLVTGGGTGLGRIMMEKFVELGADCVICGRRGGVLEETAREVMAKYPGRRVDTHAVDIRVATGGRGDDRGHLGERAARRIGQQCCRKFHLPDQGSQPARLRRHRQHRPARHVLHDQRLRQALDRREAQGERAQHPHDLGVDRQPLRRALGHVQGGRRRDDPEPRRRMGAPRHPPERHRARPLPDRRRLGAAQSAEGRRRRPLQRRAIRWAGSAAPASSPTWRRS